MKFNLTPEEKKMLRSKRIAQKSLGDYSINDIAKILNVDKERAQELVYDAFPENNMRSLAFRSPDLARAAQLSAGLKIPNSTMTMLTEINRQLQTYNVLGSGLAGLANELQQKQKILTGSGLEKMIAVANQDVFIGGSLSKLLPNSILWAEKYHKLRIPELINSVAMSGFAIKPEWIKLIGESQRLNILAQKNLGAFEWAGLGSRLNIELASIIAAQKHFMAFSADYAGMLKTIGKMPDWLESYPTLAKMPSVEYFTHSKALEVISVEDAEIIDEREERSFPLITGTAEAIEIYLPMVDAGLTKMWIGAHQALQSSNVDRIRHYNVSVRELFTHILHKLAPDDRIAVWRNDPKDFHEGRATRKARLSYICRELAGGSYARFLNKDIEAMIELINLFQGGTHGIDSDLTEPQLKALISRVENTLRFLLEVEIVTNRGSQAI